MRSEMSLFHGYLKVIVGDFWDPLCHDLSMSEITAPLEHFLLQKATKMTLVTQDGWFYLCWNVDVSFITSSDYPNLFNWLQWWKDKCYTWGPPNSELRSTLHTFSLEDNRHHSSSLDLLCLRLCPVPRGQRSSDITSATRKVSSVSLSLDVELRCLLRAHIDIQTNQVIPFPFLTHVQFLWMLCEEASVVSFQTDLRKYSCDVCICSSVRTQYCSSALVAHGHSWCLAKCLNDWQHSDISIM